MPDDGGLDDATANEEAPDSATEARSDQGGEAPADASELREDVKEEIARAVDADRERHEAQEGPKATPTQREAEAVTAARTPSQQAQEALQDTLRREQQSEQQSSAGTPRHRTAKQVVAEGEAPLAPLPGRAEPAHKDGSPAHPDRAEEVQQAQEEASGGGPA